MSDFSITAKCPGCGSRYAPDDGDCCVKCAGCSVWIKSYERAIWSDALGYYVCCECFTDGAEIDEDEENEEL